MATISNACQCGGIGQLLEEFLDDGPPGRGDLAPPLEEEPAGPIDGHLPQPGAEPSDLRIVSKALDSPCDDMEDLLAQVCGVVAADANPPQVPDDHRAVQVNEVLPAFPVVEVAYAE